MHTETLIIYIFYIYTLCIIYAWFKRRNAIYHVQQFNNNECIWFIRNYLLLKLYDQKCGRVACICVIWSFTVWCCRMQCHQRIQIQFWHLHLAFHTHSGNTKTININETLYEYISGCLLIIPNPDRVVVILSLSKSYAVEFMALFSHWFTNHNLYETMKHFHHLCGIVTIAKYCSIAWIKSVDLLVLVEISNL